MISQQMGWTAGDSSPPCAPFSRLPFLKLLVLIPSYNTGRILPQTVADVLAHWPEVWVVMDGSTDGSADLLKPLLAVHPGLSVIEIPKNGGKGAAVLHGIRLAQYAGFTHVLTRTSSS
jgi:cellulose synthase/poly-beta-1,6-N-acetylglucosamine synthase-like glycosyltransferase